MDPQNRSRLEKFTIFGAFVLVIDLIKLWFWLH